ncbi:MAG: DciA family protein, partial [Pseudomonadota bacterium]|nr:DciA family protein [Pseudomonadota bacterium]
AELRAVLPDPLCYEVEITEIRGTTAHLLCRSAATATRLRFMSNELLTRLNDLSSFAQVRELNFRIARGRG